MTTTTVTQPRTLAGLLSGRPPVLAVWTLPGDDPCASGRARALTRQALVGLRADLMVDLATTVSELVTNAGRHTRSGRAGGEICFSVAVLDGVVIATVADQGRDDDNEPAVTTPDDTSEGLRGLQICAALGSLLIEGDRHGRRISVRFPLPPTAEESQR